MSKQYLVVENATALFYYKVEANSKEEALAIIEEGYCDYYNIDYIDYEIFKVEEIKDE